MSKTLLWLPLFHGPAGLAKLASSTLAGLETKVQNLNFSSHSSNLVLIAFTLAWNRVYVEDCL